jgi:DNA-binding transcriptional regulator YhcF (GntR family)
MNPSWAQRTGIVLNHGGDVPIGVQLDWAFRAAVGAGALRPGERLPGLREVAEQLGVSHNTLRAAVAKLEVDGLLETRHGAGTYVARGADAAATAHAALVGETAQRARAAGIDPRALAAALYVSDTDEAAVDEEAGRRRALRDELAVLDRVLVELEGRLLEPLPRATTSSGRGARLLTVAELAEQRDLLIRRIADVQRALDGDDDEDPPPAEPRRVPRRAPAPRPGTAPA